jgi:hypothetical protein
VPVHLRITHPFHPLHGRSFRFLHAGTGWHRRRAYCRDRDGRLIAFPIEWTDHDPPDPFLLASAGRSAFRPRDLLELADLVERLEQRSRPGNTVT